MARRYIADPQISRLALWARRLAVFALPVALLAVIIERAGLFEIIPVLATFGASLALAVLAILVAIIALIRIWFDGRQGTRNALIAIFVSLLLLAYPGYLGMKAYRLADDLRHHDRSVRSAAVRSGGAAAHARSKSGRL